MRVALYYPWVYLTSGAERTILELTGRSRHPWTIFTHRYDRQQTFPAFRERDVVELGRASVKRSVGRVAMVALRIGRERLPLAGYDALVILSEGIGDLVVFRNDDLPTLCICLTPLRIAFDPIYRARYLERQSVWTRVVVAAGTAVFRWLDRRAWNRFDQVLCISEESKRRIVSGRLAPSEKVEIVHVGLGVVPTTDAVEFGDYFLLPGRIMWTKNLELGIEAFLRFRRSRVEFARFRLVVAGIVDEKSRLYLARLRDLARGEESVEFREFPTDAELAALYRSCYCVLFTAFNEDWGIVPLEAMAFGKPVIATDSGGPRETVLPGVTGFLEAARPEPFATRMAELASAPALARSLGANGPARARLFTWDRFVARVDERLEAAVGKGRRAAALVGVLGIALTVAACSGGSSRSGAVPPIAPQQPEVRPYRLAPGDVIDVKFYYTSDLNETLTIRPDGLISLQLAGEVRAAGLTPAELSARLREALATHVRNPEAVVIVRDFAQQVAYVGGEVTTPGAVALRGTTTVLQAVIARGGEKGNARTNQVLLVRHAGANGTTVRLVDLGRVRKGQDEDVVLQPYDVVFVPMSRIAHVGRFVEQYINALVPRAMNFPVFIFDYPILSR